MNTTTLRINANVGDLNDYLNDDLYHAVVAQRVRVISDSTVKDGRSLRSPFISRSLTLGLNIKATEDAVCALVNARRLDRVSVLCRQLRNERVDLPRVPN